MKVLYIVGSCLTKNTSANMSHNAYIQGFIENGCDVDIIMASDSWGVSDKALPIWKEATYYEYNSITLSDYLKKILHKSLLKKKVNINASHNSITSAARITDSNPVRKCLKKLFYFIFPTDPIYPLEKQWLKSASHFKGMTSYDLIISNSMPAASHKLVTILAQKNNITYKRWIQIWEDPWYFDLYGRHTENIKKEEHTLLQQATEVYYVSPLTMNYQKSLFADCADKMKCTPLPFLKLSNKISLPTEPMFGYFGDYYSKTRNLQPFYDALVASGYTGCIYGDSDLQLNSTKNITVSRRVTLDKLTNIQNQTGILVHLCNLSGGQIPGKIYHYSATIKPILFILDGTEDEIKELKYFFGKFNRYSFCENNFQSILKALKDLILDYGKKEFTIIDDFSPKNIVKKLISEN